MLDEEEKEMSTKNKINSLINDIQKKLNKRVSNNYTIKPSNGKGYQYNNRNNPNRINNYIDSTTSPNFAYQQPILDSAINEYNLRNLIQEEFLNMIIPYQKDLNSIKKIVDDRLNESEKKIEMIINAQNMGNLNDNAKIISTYLSSNISNDNSRKNFEKLKMEYDSKLDKMENKFNSILEQINVIKEDNNKNEQNLENFKKSLEIKEEKEQNEKNKEMELYLEKNIFDSELNKINQRINIVQNNHNQNNQNIQKLNDQIDNVTKLINQFKIEINKINSLDNNINSIRGEFGKITEDISSLKFQISPEIINKINAIDINKLKQQVSLIEFNKLKNDMNNYGNNFYSVKNITENNDRNISDLKIIINDMEQKQNLINKNIEENLNNKIKELNNQLEELSKKIKEKEEKKEEVNLKNNEAINENEKKEEEPELFIGSSRRQQRNSKSINANINNNKNQNINLDEKSLNFIKQLEKINLDELQNMNFNGLLNQIGDLSRENKILSEKIEQQNKTIEEINEKINKLNSNNNEFKISNINQRNINLNENNKEKEKEKEKEKKDSFTEDDYDDFDKDLNFQTEEKNITEKENVEEKIKPSNDNNDNNKDIIKNNLIEDKNYRNDILQKSKNEYGSFSKYSEVNILDQIMGIGDKKQGFGNDFSEPKFGGGSTFITGSLNENNNNNNINYNIKPSIFEEDKRNSENNKDKDIDLNKDLNQNNKEEKINEDDDDNFDDFDAEEI